MAESLHLVIDQWIQYKLGKQYLIWKITLHWESNPGLSREEEEEVDQSCLPRTLLEKRLLNKRATNRTLIMDK